MAKLSHCSALRAISDMFSIFNTLDGRLSPPAASGDDGGTGSLGHMAGSGQGMWAQIMQHCAHAATLPSHCRHMHVMQPTWSIRLELRLRPRQGLAYHTFMTTSRTLLGCTCFCVVSRLVLNSDRCAASVCSVHERFHISRTCCKYCSEVERGWLRLRQIVNS